MLHGGLGACGLTQWRAWPRLCVWLGLVPPHLANCGLQAEATPETLLLSVCLVFLKTDPLS